MDVLDVELKKKLDGEGTVTDYDEAIAMTTVGKVPDCTIIGRLYRNFLAGCRAIARAITGGRDGQGTGGVTTADTASPTTMAANITEMAIKNYNDGLNAATGTTPTVTHVWDPASPSAGAAANIQAKVTSEGYAALAINLGSGEYGVKVSYDGALGKNQTSVKVNVKTTLFGEDIVKYYKNDTQFYASFLDTSGSPLKNSQVKFNINGIFYTRMTDEKGVAKLNINLGPGKYIITSINSKTGEQISNYITVKSVIVENHDLVKYYRNASQYRVKILDGQGNPLSGVNVTFIVNCIFNLIYLNIIYSSFN